MNKDVLTNTSLMITAITCAGLIAVAEYIPVFGLIIQLVVTLAVLKHAFEVLNMFARGRSNTDAAPLDGFGYSDLRYLLFILVWGGLLFRVAPFLSSSLGLPAQIKWAVIGVLVTALPASAALVSVNKSIVAAFNPAAILEMARTMGRFYWELVGFCLVVAFASGFIQSTRLGLPSFVSSIVLNFVAIWSVLVIFAGIGSAMYAQHDALGIKTLPGREAERDSTELRKKWRASLDLAYPLFRNARYRDCQRQLATLLTPEDADYDICVWVINELSGWSESCARSFASAAVERLDRQGHSADARRLWLNCRTLFKNFEVDAELDRKMTFWNTEPS